MTRIRVDGYRVQPLLCMLAITIDSDGGRGEMGASACRRCAPRLNHRHAGFQLTCFAIQLDPILSGMNPGRMQGEFDIGCGTAAGDRCDDQQHAGLAVRVVGAKAWA